MNPAPVPASADQTPSSDWHSKRNSAAPVAVTSVAATPEIDPADPSAPAPELSPDGVDYPPFPGTAQPFHKPTHQSSHEPTHGVPEAVSSLMRTIIVALFVLTFLAQPMVIPSESMEHTLLVGDFLLMNRSTLAPMGIWHRILPYAGVERGEIVTFHSPLDPKSYLVKRVIGLPGDRLRIENGRVFINGQQLNEPYAAFEPTTDNPYLDHFPTKIYSDPGVDPSWWKQLQQDSRNGELVIPPNEYFMMGDNRNHSRDSRYWGFVQRSQIIARPLVIYFSLKRPSRTDVQQADDDRLSEGRRAQQSALSAHLTEFARWKRIFHVVH